MKNLRSGLIIFAGALIIVQFGFIDFDDLSWAANSSSYLGILSMTCVIIAMFLSNRAEKRKS
jgi:hypothetical protein